MPKFYKKGAMDYVQSHWGKDFTERLLDELNFRDLEDFFVSMMKRADWIDHNESACGCGALAKRHPEYNTGHTPHHLRNHSFPQNSSVLPPFPWNIPVSPGIPESPMMYVCGSDSGAYDSYSIPSVPPASSARDLSFSSSLIHLQLS